MCDIKKETSKSFRK